MTADVLLSRLHGVKATGRGRWVARCPAHKDRRPSLAVRELDDGRVLVHDFAGCAVEDVLAAVGLEFDALYPERAVDQRAGRERRPFNAYDVLTCCAQELLVGHVAIQRVAQGNALTERERERLLIATERLLSAVELIHVRG